ncbi:hypothetical protein [Clostridium sp.]|jgi:hypothetical protein|uniref:hypothetical protein n=1 Tax=Clostridium sp. TaxID=1506 RepID=UPI003EEDF04D
MKKSILSLLGIIIIVCIAFISYSRIYTITDNKRQLEDSITQFNNRPTVIANNIDIKQELNLDNKKYILFMTNNTLGDAELTKGLNSKYKIEVTGGGGAYFRYEIYKTNKGKYLILKGKNPNRKIAYTKITLENKEYTISIPQQEYFIAYCTVPNGTQLIYPETRNIKFYDMNDIDITDETFKVLLFNIYTQKNAKLNLAVFQ